MSASKLHDLIALAREPSSERRRELLREVTDIFLVSPEGYGPSEVGLFDDVLTHLAGEMEVAVRTELAERIAPAPKAPVRLVRKLANDDIAVAAVILATSAALSEADLVAVAQNQGQAHLQAISQRQTVPETVSEVIVERGDDTTLGVLLRNDGAALSRQAHEVAVDRAQASPVLHQAVLDREAVPIDLLNEMYFVVESRLRKKILERNTSIDPAALETALAKGRRVLAARHGALPDDYDEAERAVNQMLARKAINPPVLAGMLRNRETTKFTIALAELAEIDFHTARRILEQRELDALAIVCKAADFDRPLFITFAILVLDREAGAMGRAREYGELYAQLPKDSAQRTLRFWRLRRTTGDAAAA